MTWGKRTTQDTNEGKWKRERWGTHTDVGWEEWMEVDGGVDRNGGRVGWEDVSCM